MVGVRGAGDMVTSSVATYSAPWPASMLEECLRRRAARGQGGSACLPVLTAARGALDFRRSSPNVGFSVPPRLEPRRH